MSLRSGVERVDGARRRLDRGIQAARLLRASDVPVDRLRNRDAPNAELGQLLGDVHRPVASREHERIDPEVPQPNLEFRRGVECHRPGRKREGIDAARAENASAAREDPAYVFDAQRDDLFAAEETLRIRTGSPPRGSTDASPRERTHELRRCYPGVAASREQADTQRPTRRLHSRLLWRRARGLPLGFDALRTMRGHPSRTRRDASGVRCAQGRVRNWLWVRPLLLTTVFIAPSAESASRSDSIPLKLPVAVHEQRPSGSVGMPSCGVPRAPSRSRES